MPDYAAARPSITWTSFSPPAATDLTPIYFASASPDARVLTMGLGDIDANGTVNVAVATSDSMFPGGFGIGVALLPHGPTYVELTNPHPSQALAPTTIGVAQGALYVLWESTSASYLTRYEVPTPEMVTGPSWSVVVDLARASPRSLRAATLGGGVDLVLLTTQDPSGNLVSLPFEAGSGTELSPYDWGPAEPAVFVDLTDLDADGNPDAIAVTRDQVLLAVDTGASFAPPTAIDISTCSAQSAAIGDFNDDTAPDVAIGGDCGVMLLLANP